MPTPALPPIFAVVWPIAQGGVGAQGTISGSMAAAQLQDLFPATITQGSSTDIAAQGNAGLGFHLSGHGFTYGANDLLVSGSASHFTFTDVNSQNVQVLQLDLALPGTSVANFEYWLAYNQTDLAFSTILSGADTLQGGAGGDVIRGYAGDDQIYGNAGADTIVESSGVNYLRGGDGADSIVAGTGFDDINGNMGNDTLDSSANGGLHWLVGGQGDDLVHNYSGSGILYGNLGNDTLIGPSNASQLIRGGQGDDSIAGGSGDDWLSGDRGSDTLSGGQGADTFHTFSGAGLDRVTDFNAAQNDHVVVDAGTTYTVAQSGADTVIDMGNGDQMILVGVTLANLPADWISTV